MGASPWANTGVIGGNGVSSSVRTVNSVTARDKKDQSDGIIDLKKE